MWRDLWRYRRRAMAVAGCVVAGLLAVAVILAATLGAGGRHRAAAPSATPPPDRSSTSTPHETASGYDHRPWDAVPAVPAGTSRAFPPLPAADRVQPDLFVQAFGIELLTRDYRRASRQALLAWAASESARLSIEQVPLTTADRSKALLVSLVSPAWDNDPSTLVPSDGDWASLAAQDAHTTVTDVKVEDVPGFHPADVTLSDPLTLDRLFTATVTLQTEFGDKPVTSSKSVAFEVVLGTSMHHGRVFGAAMTQHYVEKDFVP